MSTFALIVTTSPIDSKTHTALAVAKQVHAEGHQLLGVFFYQDGVLNANGLLQMPSDEVNPLSSWQEFAKETACPLHLCITAAERRGLSDGANDLFNNIDAAFTISGLGELVVLTSKADKVVQL